MIRSSNLKIFEDQNDSVGNGNNENNDASEKMNIPLVIHQMWLDKNVSNNSIPPEKYLKLGYPQSWIEMNPNFQYKLWNWEKVNQLFEREELAPWKHFFHSRIKKHIEKCDFARYAIMFVEGGVYVDLDFKCNREITSLVQEREIGLVWEPREHSVSSDRVERRLYNGFLVSKPNHWLWPQLMNHVVENYRPVDSIFSSTVMLNTGPARVAHFAKKFNLTEKYPHFFIDTCLVLPFLEGGVICSECKTRSVFQPYAHTLWNEGSEWNRDTVIRFIKMVVIAIVLLIVAVVLLFKLRNKSK